MPLQVKVCGLTEPALVEQACALGAAFVGFVFFPPSPRYVTPVDAAALADRVPPSTRTVGVVVDPSDDFLDQLLSELPLDLLQLHGYETPERVQAIALRTGCRVMKALRIETSADLAAVPDFLDVADLLLFDAKPPRDAAWPGGHGLPFDWRLLEGLKLPKPWALAGGLNPDNVAAAVERVNPPIVDVSSGIEIRPGVKDPAKLAAFLGEATRLAAAPKETSP